MVASSSGSLLLRVPLAINVFVFSPFFNIEKILPLAFLMKNYSVIRLFALVCLEYMSLVLRKPVFGVSDQVPHKRGCTATEDG